MSKLYYRRLTCPVAGITILNGKISQRTTQAQQSSIRLFSLTSVSFPSVIECGKKSMNYYYDYYGLNFTTVDDTSNGSTVNFPKPQGPRTPITT